MFENMNIYLRERADVSIGKNIELIFAMRKALKLDLSEFNLGVFTSLKNNVKLKYICRYIISLLKYIGGNYEK